MSTTPAPPRALWLELTDSGRRVMVPEDGRDFLIGRSASAALSLADPACSREHAILRWDGRAVQLTPVALRQPTFVNDAPFDRPTPVRHGDTIRCGTTALRVIVTGAAPGTPPSVASVIEDATALADAGTPHVSSATLPPVTARGDLVLGRDPSVAGLVLDHPTVSRRHAVIRAAASPPQIRDLDSGNGTFVNGERVTGSRALTDDDVVRVGPFSLRWRAGTLTAVHPAGAAELSTQGLIVEVTSDAGPKRLLNDVSIAIRAREFVAIIGPSGCGKSTLIRALSGRSHPSGGSVAWSGADLYRNFDAVKKDIAFVPQRETLPELLTVRECLTYTARLRLPTDTTPNEIAKNVNDAITRVRLDEQAETRIGRLSGGQRKRAALANELLNEPLLLFLDEVTSGLDEATDREMMEVFRSLADSGMAVVCVTHTLANVEKWCDSLLVMARGVVAYHGPVADARGHFQAPVLGDIYESLQHVSPGDWRTRHEAGSPYHARVTSRAASAAPTPEAKRRRDGPGALAQFLVLTRRYLATTLADRRTLAMAAIQSVAIATFLRLVFGGSAPAPPKDFQLLFLLGVSAFWFGCNNAAKEIIKERAMFELERDVNLRIPSYVLSKLAILAAVGGLQVLLLLLLVQATGLAFAEPRAILGLMLLTVTAGTACGLLISAAASSEDQAITIVPIALIPQILLSDAVVSPLPDAARVIAKGAITTYWMYRAELQALAVKGVDGVQGGVMLGTHLAVCTVAAMLALWWRDRIRHA